MATQLKVSIKYLVSVSQALKVSLLILSLVTTVNLTANAQTIGFTYMSSFNGGNPPTRHSPITEIIDFVGYNDSLASGLSGQAFEIKLLSGHLLKFTLKKTGNPFSAFPAKTNLKAGMGRVAYIPPASTIFPILYSTTKPCNAIITIDNITVLQPDGLTQSSSWNIIVIDSETTNNASETITTTTNGRNWTSWDLITDVSSNPIESGIGASTVTWTGTVNGETGAYAIASIKPTFITSSLIGVRQGISIGVQTYDFDFELQACSGVPFKLSSKPSPGMSFTWSEPVIVGDDARETLTGGTSQTTAAAGTSQTLINNSQEPATAIYIVTPYDESGIDLAPFTVNVTVNPTPKASILYAGSYCSRGFAEVTQTGQTGGTYTSDSSLSINRQTGAIDLQSSSSGKHTITYVFNDGSCTDSVKTEIQVYQQPTVLITDPAAVCGPGSIDLRSTAITAGSTPGLTFSYWKDENATVPLFNPSAVSENGVYYIKGIIATGCWDIKAVNIITSLCPPFARDDAYETIEDIPLILDSPGILINDTYVTDKPTMTVLLKKTSHGDLIINTDGSFVYSPNANFHGIDSFTYEVRNGDLNSNIATVMITVKPVNDPPSAADDAYATREDTPISIAAPGILLNDSDPDGDSIIAMLVTAPENGKLIINPDGSLTYTPNPNFNGTDRFTYKVSDGDVESNIATVTISVTPVNDPPLAANDNYATTEGVPITIATPGILLNDRDPDGGTIKASLVTGPLNGKLIINPDGSFIYTPDPNFHGIDQFTYKVSDGNLESNIATVLITVTSVNESPVAADDHFELGMSDLQGRLNLNDYDPDGDPLIYTVIAAPQHGGVQLNTDGTFLYLPIPGFSGTDYFVYRICDSAGLCAEAKVLLTARPSAIVSLTPAHSKIVEGSKVTITAVLNQAFPEDVRITLNYTGDAHDGKDYTLFENFVTINIPAGQTTATEYLVLAALIDDLNEKEEQILISISDVNSDRVKIGSGAEVSIVDIYPPSKEVTDEPANTEIRPDPLISPNGDGQGNERFFIDKIDLYPDNLVLIFNRWGNEVFRINSYNNNENSFRGIANTGILTNTGKDLSEGVYYYLIHTTDSDNKKTLNKGYLILKR